MRRFPFSMAGIVLAGCAAPQIHWTHPSQSANLAADRYACVQESRVSWNARGGLLWVAAAQADADAQAQQLFIMCMQARGWKGSVVPPAQAPPPQQYPPPAVSAEPFMPRP